mmetsp:Transcript_1054/g.3176  ORF Transcript_1054/g.3176 Transcript_1054/m.3176 type:complete len:362 (+) Transcript_1054:172-1257(+)
MQPKRKAAVAKEAERGYQVPTVVVDDLLELNTPTVEQVWVHVYELGQELITQPRQKQKLRGAFHTGVEVYGREWSYGSDIEDAPTGIIWNNPRRNGMHTFRETLQLGYTTYSPKRVIEIIEDMKEEWPADEYDVVTRNCHHFCAALSTRLGAAGVPTWLHDLADVGGVKPGRVSLKVYDLGQTVLTRGYNAVNKSYGAFHTGVEVYGREWSFGAAPEGYSGIGENPPGENTMHSFRETLVMGYTKFNPEEIYTIIEEMAEEWHGASYDVFTKNCHNFSQAFCQRLGVPGIPSWVNDLASSLAPKSEGRRAARAGMQDAGDAGPEASALAPTADGVRRSSSEAMDPRTSGTSQHDVNPPAVN